jgi:hypothetical protein
MTDKTVRVTLNSSGLPVPADDPITIKKNSEKITWCADFDFTIDIEGGHSVTKDHGGSDCPHRTKTGTFSSEGQVKYSITANGKTNDPIIDVRP